MIIGKISVIIKNETAAPKFNISSLEEVTFEIAANFCN